MDDLLRSQYLVARKWVTQRFPFHEVHIPPEDGLQFVHHVHPVGQAPPSILGEADHNAHVAVGSEVVAQDRAEKRKLHDLPFLAERLYGFLRDFYAQPPSKEPDITH